MKIKSILIVAVILNFLTFSLVLGESKYHEYERLIEESHEIKNPHSITFGYTLMEPKPAGQGNIYTLRFNISHFSKTGEKFYFLVANLYGCAHCTEMIVNKQRQLETTGPKRSILLNGSTFSVASQTKAEPFTFYLISEDKKTFLKDKFIANEVKAVDKDQATISLELVSPEGNIFKIFGEGFKHGELLISKSHSGDETINHFVIPEPDGTFVAMICPAVKGKNGGTARYEIHRGKKIMSLEYEWGDQLTLKK